MPADHLEQIETQLSFLETANAELSDVVYAQQRLIEALHARLNVVETRLRAVVEAGAMPDPAEQERPPHY